MYEAILQSTDRPFRATPDERFYFPFDSIEHARQTLARVVRRAEGPAMVMGGSGLGKTMLAQVLGQDLSDLFDVVKLHATRLCSRRALLQSILFELQMPYRDLSEGELRLSLMSRMERSPEYAPSGLLLIVDEAHSLPVKLLEELRLITNFSRSGQPRARLILVGSLALEDIFARPQLDSFNQRLAARCYLQPMNRQQTHSFIVHQLRCISEQPYEVVTRDALDAVYAASEGIPRIANQVMDHSLVLAITSGQSPISAALVEEAWSDLQQLPAPWNGSTETSSSVPIEFGTLEDDDQASEFDDDSQIRLPSGTSIEPLPATMPAFQLDSSDDWHQNATTIPAEQAVHGFEEPKQEYNEYSFFESFQDVGHTSQLPPERRLASVPEAPIEPRMNSFSQPNSEELDRIEAACRDTQGQRPSAQLFAPSTANNDMEMLDVVDDSHAQLFAVEDLGSITVNHWEYSPSGLNSISEASSIAVSLPTIETAEQTSAAPSTEASHSAAPEHTRAADPFGDDFDEEFSIETPAQGTWVSEQAPASANQTELRRPDLFRGFVQDPSRERQTTSPFAPVQCSIEDIQSHIRVQPERSVQPATVASGADEGQKHVWQVDTSTAQGTSEEHLRAEVEDLISQLNFSAFSIEPESVEQISVDYLRVAAPAAIQVLGQTAPENEPPIYSIHEELSEDAFQVFDDDREMLIIEEDIPLSMRLGSVLQAPTRAEAQNYSQLFTNLRS